MHLPSLLTSKLIANCGSRDVVLFGIIISAIGAFLYVGDTYAFVAASLAVLALGWNFTFVGATTTLVSTCNATEQFAAQALNETVVFGISAVMMLLAGNLLQAGGDAVPLAIGSGAILAALSLADAIYLAIETFKDLRCRRIMSLDQREAESGRKKIDELSSRKTI